MNDARQVTHAEVEAAGRTIYGDEIWPSLSSEIVEKALRAAAAVRTPVAAADGEVEAVLCDLASIHGYPATRDRAGAMIRRLAAELHRVKAVSESRKNKKKVAFTAREDHRRGLEYWRERALAIEAEHDALSAQLASRPPQAGEDK